VLAILTDSFYRAERSVYVNWSIDKLNLSYSLITTQWIICKSSIMEAPDMSTL